jgi:DnaJ-class molecular chaperone
MIFILREKPHAFFKREKDNLVYIADITLKQALCGVKLFIPTFDGKNNKKDNNIMLIRKDNNNMFRRTIDTTNTGAY